MHGEGQAWWLQGEGLDAMWQRHTDMHHMLWDGLAEMGLEPYVPEEQDRLVTVNTIRVRSPTFTVLYLICRAHPQNISKLLGLL
jgi:hypothetical protein